MNKSCLAILFAQQFCTSVHQNVNTNVIVT